MLLRLLTLLLFLVGVLVGGLWILIEAAGALAKGADSVWYIAFVVTIIPVLLLGLIAFRSRTPAFVALTAVAVALFAGVLATHPSGDSTACRGGNDNSSASSNSTISSEDLGGALVDTGLGDTVAAPANCQ